MGISVIAHGFLWLEVRLQIETNTSPFGMLIDRLVSPEFSVRKVKLGDGEESFTQLWCLGSSSTLS
jgi:hypothetical protein